MRLHLKGSVGWFLAGMITSPPNPLSFQARGRRVAQRTFPSPERGRGTAAAVDEVIVCRI